MNFEDMQKIWDEQNGKTLFAIDEKSLEKQLNKKISKSNRSVNWMEWGIVIINLIVSTVMTYKAITQERNHLFITAGVAFVILIYMLVSRIGRKKKEERYDDTMLSRLDNALNNLRYHASMARNFVWWYLLPLGLTSVLNMYVRTESKEIWEWLLMILLFPLAYYLPVLEVKKVHMPRIKALEDLKSLLTQDDPSPVSKMK